MTSAIDKAMAKAVERTPQMKRGLVWCMVCGATQRVDSMACLRTGWPKCCGYTMTIDSPEERVAFKRREDG